MNGDDKCYCALCAASVSGPRIAIGSTATDALRRRHVQIKRGLQRREMGQYLAWVSGNDENSEDIEVEHNEAEEDEEYNPAFEPWTYDPRLVHRRGLTWLRDILFLGFDSSTVGGQKAFISGDAKLTENGRIEAVKGDDSNFPEWKLYFIGYITGMPSQHITSPMMAITSSIDPEAVFPFHKCCFEILPWALTGSMDARNLDKETLYEVLSDLSRDKFLNLDYGAISGSAGLTHWVSIPGEELSVIHPTDCPRLKESLMTILQSGMLTLPSEDLDLQHKVVADPFNTLPYDVLHQILTYLPGKSVLTLTEASWTVNSATRYNLFWRGLINWDMPWFWELRSIFGELENTEINFKAVYLFLDRVTTPSIMVTGPFLGIANRRRIWGSCQDIMKLYFKPVDRKTANETDQEAKEIIQRSKVLYMPVVSYPQTEETVNTITTQWVYSWQEIDCLPSTLEVNWNHDESIAGLSMTFGGSRRTFGRDTDAVSAVRIPGNDWIDMLALRIPELDLRDKLTETSMRAITVFFKSGRQVTLGHPNWQLCSRPLVASKGNFIVGLTGQIQNGIISRLGVLECSRPRPGDSHTIQQHDTASVSPDTLQNSSRHHLLQLYGTEIPAPSRSWKMQYAPAWSHPSIGILPVPNMGYLPPQISTDLVPYRFRVWAHHPEGLRDVVRISARVVNGIEDDPNNPGTQTASAGILGLNMQLIEGNEMARYIGSIGTESYDEYNSFIKDKMQHFDIDGPGGEYITEVGISKPHAQAIRFRTNRDREVVFGHRQQLEWDVLRPAGGDFIIGMAIRFARKIMWEDEKGVHTHLALTSATALITSGLKKQKKKRSHC